MVRAAAKNHAHVGVVVDPADYDPVLAELRGERLGSRRRRGAASPATAFARTAAYDAEIVAWLDGPSDRPPSRRRLPPTLTCGSSGPRSCATARTPTRRRPATGASARRAGGTPPSSTAARRCSYLNLYDAEAAWRLVHRFDEPACVIVKHANPCGVAVADDIADGLRAGQRLRSGQRLRRHRRPQPAGARRRGRPRWPRCSPRSSSRPATTTTRLGAR